MERFHHTQLPNCALPPEKLGYEIARLRFDALVVCIASMRAELSRQAKADAVRDRARLSRALAQAASELGKAEREVRRAFQVSKPYLKKELSETPALF